MPDLVRCHPEEEMFPCPSMPSKTMPGYSIPVENPATLIAAGYG